MEYFLVEKEIGFDMGHRVPQHKSKCRNPHGHRYKVVAVIEGPLVDSAGASDEGMVMDFSDIKKVMTEKIHDVYDHGFMIWDKDKELEWFFFPHEGGEESVRCGWNLHKVPFVPTAENLAKHFYEILVNNLHSPGARVHSVKVWETPTSVATYPSRAYR